MLIRIYKLTCDYCSLVVEQDTNKFPSGWKWSQILLDPVRHICSACLDSEKAAGRNWKDGGQQKSKRVNAMSRGEQSLQPMKLTPTQATELQSNLDAGTARPRIKVKPIKEESHVTKRLPTPSKDDPKYHEPGTHFNLWTACSIVVVAVFICYFTNTYPWINGVFKL